MLWHCQRPRRRLCTFRFRCLTLFLVDRSL
jgi:hypothetical protein